MSTISPFLTFSVDSSRGSRVDVSNHDEPALSICSTLWAYVVFFHILFYSVHPSQFRSAPGSGSWNLSRQDILCYIVFFSPLNMTEPGQSFLREESVYWLYVGIFTDGSNISNMIFSCLSLHPSQHLHFCCICQQSIYQNKSADWSRARLASGIPQENRSRRDRARYRSGVTQK